MDYIANARNGISGALVSGLMVVALLLSLVIALFYRGGERADTLALSALLITLATTAVIVRGVPRWWVSREGRVVWLALGFTLWACGSYLWSSAPSTTLLTLVLPLAGWLALLLGASMGRASRRWLQRLLLLLGLLLVALSVSQTIRMEGIRPYGLMYNTNNHAAFINLILLTLSARLLWVEQRRDVLLSGVGIVLLAMVVGLSQSRGALLGLGAGLAVLLLAGGAWRRYRRVALLLAWIASGFLSATLFQESSVVGRLQVTEQQLWESVDVASSSRLTLWESGWQLYLQRPLLGWGLGSFWTIYPQFKTPLESSAGQHVHNDYLEVLLELGPLGLLLLVAAGVVLLRQGVKLARRGGRQGLEAAGLLAAITAVAVHALFTFNLYIMSIVLVVGLYAGWLVGMAQEEDMQETPPVSAGLAGAARLGAIGLLLVTSLWLLALFVSEYRLQRLGQEGGAGEALYEIERIGRLFPGRDTADLLVASQIISALHEGAVAVERRDEVVAYALRALERGREKFPLRWENPYYRAELMRQATVHPRSEIESSYREALHLNPAFLRARIAYADYLTKRGEATAAYRLLEAGWGRYYYDYGVVIAAYLGMVEQTRRQHDDEAGAARARLLQQQMLQGIREQKYNMFNFVAN